MANPACFVGTVLFFLCVFFPFKIPKQGIDTFIIEIWCLLLLGAVGSLKLKTHPPLKLSVLGIEAQVEGILKRIRAVSQGCRPQEMPVEG